MKVCILLLHKEIVNMTIFKAKLRRIGNSQGVYIPKYVITGYDIDDVITLSLEDKDVITEKQKKYTQKVAKEVALGLNELEGKTVFNTEQCKKHTGSMKGTCGCK